MAKLHLFRCSLGACINEYAEKTSLILSINERAQSLSLSLSLSLSPSPSFFLRSPLSQCSKYSFFFPSFLSFLLDWTLERVVESTFLKNSYSCSDFAFRFKSALTTTRVPHKNKIFAHVPLRRSQWHDYFVYHHRVVVVVVVVVVEGKKTTSGEIILDDDNNKNKNFDLSSGIVIFFKQQ